MEYLQRMGLSKHAHCLYDYRFRTSLVHGPAVRNYNHYRSSISSVKPYDLHYLAILSLIWQHLTYTVISTPVGHIYPYCGNVPTLCVLMLKLCAKLESNRTISFGVMAFLRMGIQKV